MNWYAIYTKPHKEKLVAELLSNLTDVEVLNPIVKVKKFRNKRLTSANEELFPSYIFARFDLYKYYHTIKYTRGVRKFVGRTESLPYIISEDIINMIKERIVNGYIRLDPPELKKGDKVIVRFGPMRGLRGIFLSDTKPSERITILLNTLSYQAKVEIDKNQLVKDMDNDKNAKAETEKEIKDHEN